MTTRSTHTTDTANTSIRRSSPLTINDITLIALFTSITAVCSWISVPATVPFTLQTFAVFLTCGLLGGRRGTVTVIIYLLLGAIGIPVFSGFTGGIGHLLGPTGGYIIGFLFTALIMWGAEAVSGRGTSSASGAAGRTDFVLALSMLLGLAACYAFGTAWFMTVYARTSGPIGLQAALGWCVLPYIIPDLIKIAVALLLCRRLRPALARV